MRQIFTLLLFSALFACGEDVDPEPGALPQLWKLTEIRGSMTGHVIREEDIPYTETILLKADSTFIKTREENGQRLQAEGMFSVEKDATDTWIRLEYEAENSLIENCTNSLSEFLWLNASGQLTGGAVACDYPGYTYSRQQLPI